MILKMDCAYTMHNTEFDMKYYPDAPWDRVRHKFGYVINDSIAPSLMKTALWVSKSYVYCYKILAFDLSDSVSFMGYSLIELFSLFMEKGKNWHNYIITYWVITSPRGIWVAFQIKLCTVRSLRYYSFEKL